MSKPTTTLLALGLAGSLLLGATACSSSDSGGDSSSKSISKITMCSDIPYAPMEMPGDGPRGLKYTGFDVELMDAMAQELGATLDVIDVDFDGIIGNLASGKCTVVASSLTITPEREKQADFTKPYFNADQSLLVPTKSGVRSLDDLAGKTIGVQSSTTGETYANENKPSGATIKSFPDTDGLFGALAAGSIQGVLQDLPVNAGRVATDSSVAVVETFKTGEQYGFAVETGSALRAKLNSALAAVKADGTYEKLYNKYFPKA